MFSPTRYGESVKMTGQRQNVGIHTNCQKSLSRQCPQGLWDFNCHSPLQEIRIFTPLNPLGGLCQPTESSLMILFRQTFCQRSQVCLLKIFWEPSDFSLGNSMRALEIILKKHFHQTTRLYTRQHVGVENGWSTIVNLQ